MGLVNRVINNRGQALIEATAIFPIVVGLTVLIFFCSYIVLARKWTDYWVYRAALCQTTTINTLNCHRDLNHKLELVLPKTIFKTEATWITRRESHVAVRIQIAEVFQMSVKSTVPVDL
jgi:hypothetical protein